jgi:hypothetical protein
LAVKRLGDTASPSCDNSRARITVTRDIAIPTANSIENSSYFDIGKNKKRKKRKKVAFVEWCTLWE